MRIELFFTNLDNFMGTDAHASVTMDIWADDAQHLRLMADHLQRVLGADHYRLADPGSSNNP